MRIDIGNGKILGTKKVSPNGQISGFTEFAGRDVLVVLPEDEIGVTSTVGGITTAAPEYIKEVQAATLETMKIAFRQYQDLKAKYATPERAAAEYIKTHAPRNFQGLIDQVDTWARQEVKAMEDKVERALNEDRRGIKG
ncbi:MAG: hypothetical protein HY556_07590 [Euryarchaeota archaeon]|nr:hypothetical protein [Euryarchaeota archaeon]